MMTARHRGLPPAFDTLHVGTALYDPETGRILDANDRLETLMGYATARLRELPVERYTANGYPFSAADFVEHLRASAAGESRQFEWRIKRGDGELIWARVHLSRYRAAGEDRVFAEIRDITDYNDTTHRAELFWRLLRHNLRNAAAVIQGYAKQLHADAPSEARREMAARIQSRASELGNMANSVKQIEQAVNASEERRVRRNATAAVEAVAADVAGEWPDAELTVEAHEEMWIHVDRAFRHALTHALENALTHNEDGEPRVEVEIAPSPNTGRVDISISDTNPAIDQAEIDALFTRSTTTNVSHGSGVGMFVMKWCIESLGGEIGFERRTPEGNTVHFYLPPKAPPA